MKTTFALLLISFALVDFKSPEKLFVPPGTVKVSDTLYFDKAEISNQDWRQYEDWNKQTYGAQSAQHLNSMPDTVVWRDLLAYSEPYVKYYYRHPAYNNHPVVGISWEQAVDYCKWRTEIAKKQAEQNAKSNMLMPVSFSYRLPTEAEWEEVAKAGYEEKFQKQIKKKHLKPTSLHNVISDSIPPAGTMFKTHSSADITAPVYTYFPNNLRIYNLIGNVSEMTTTKGIAKGGGWNDRIGTITIEKEFTYEKPTSWLGFRCVSVVKWN